jgi:hypothetical protein
MKNRVSFFCGVGMDEKKKRTLTEWEDAIEKQIREAMERGEFDNLKGKGKPLDLERNPFTPEDWQLAYKIMQDNNVAPEWIEQGKSIRDELQALTAWFEKQAQWQRDRARKAKSLAIEKIIAEREHLAIARAKTCAQFRDRAELLNKAIDLFNLQAPPGIPHFTRVRIEGEIKKFLAASG